MEISNKIKEKLNSNKPALVVSGYFDSPNIVEYISSLNVDGIIPDSSFGIKKPIPKWPLNVLITLTIVFAGLSVIFYLEEEETYPELNKWLQKVRGKFNQFWLRFKYGKSG